MSSLNLTHFARIPEQMRDCHVVIGKFDGVHLGHQKVVQTAKALSVADNRPVVALMLDRPGQNPRADEARFGLTEKSESHRYLHKFGVDYIVSAACETNASYQKPERTLQRVLSEQLGARSIVTGLHARFGGHRAGSVSLLRKIGSSEGISVVVAPTICVGGQRISSTIIRDLLGSGYVRAANALLGRCWSLRGEVVHGDKRGRLLGFPTANIVLQLGLGLRYGVYAVRVHLKDQVKDAVACFGSRPQFDNGAPRLEVHLLNFSGDLYGQTIRVDFVAFQRAESRFESVAALVEQMHTDCIDARRHLEQYQDKEIRLITHERPIEREAIQKHQEPKAVLKKFASRLSL